MNICINCAHSTRDGYGCNSPQRPKIDPVTGRENPSCYCSAMRGDSQFCGLDAKWFEPKTPDPGVGWRLLAIGEVINQGDEIYFGNNWIASGVVGDAANCPHRRRIALEIAKCPMGHEVFLESDMGMLASKYFIHCPICHWKSATFSSASAAQAGWNAVMEAYHKAKGGTI
jgi:hypothetical protein